MTSRAPSSEQPGGDRRGRDRVGEDDAAAEDPARARLDESIGHTQPRRIAARAIAERIAEELGSSSAGWSATGCASPTRSGPATRIKLMTDGILLNELQRDRDLQALRRDHHRRGARAQPHRRLPARLPRSSCCPQRPDLKVIVTSATIDPESFSRHFALGAPPVVEVSGRTYPVEVRYRPLRIGATCRRGRATARNPRADRDATCSGASSPRSTSSRPSRPVTCSSSSRARTRSAMPRMPSKSRPGAEVLPLYGRLSAADQHRVFESRPCRRPAPGRARDQRRRDEPHGARHQVRGGCRHRPHQPVQRALQDPAAAHRGDQPGERARSAPGVRGARATASRSASTPRRTSIGAPSTPTPRSCAPNLAAVILQMLSLGLGDDRGVPVPDAARLARREGRARPAGGAGRTV